MDSRLRFSLIDVYVTTMITHVNHHEDNNNKEGINRSQFEENFLTAMDEGDLPTEVKLAWYHAIFNAETFDALWYSVKLVHGLDSKAALPFVPEKKDRHLKSHDSVHEIKKDYRKRVMESSSNASDSDATELAEFETETPERRVSGSRRSSQGAASSINLGEGREGTLDSQVSGSTTNRATHERNTTYYDHGLKQLMRRECDEEGNVIRLTPMQHTSAPVERGSAPQEAGKGAEKKHIVTLKPPRKKAKAQAVDEDRFAEVLDVAALERGEPGDEDFTPGKRRKSGAGSKRGGKAGAGSKRGGKASGRGGKGGKTGGGSTRGGRRSSLKKADQGKGTPKPKAVSFPDGDTIVIRPMTDEVAEPQGHTETADAAAASATVDSTSQAGNTNGPVDVVAAQPQLPGNFAVEDTMGGVRGALEAHRSGDYAFATAYANALKATNRASMVNGVDGLSEVSGDHTGQ